MLAAYYSKGCDSHFLFDPLKISKTSRYEEHINTHHVIYLNMQRFVSRSADVHEMLGYLTEKVVEELPEVYEITKDSMNV